jgi:hypothetical protein
MKKVELKEIDKTEFVTNKLKLMSKKEFRSFLKSIDELDVWEDSDLVVLDVFNNVDDRIAVIDMGFEEEDIEKYYEALNK